MVNAFHKEGSLMKKDHLLMITIRVLAYIAVLIILMMTWRVMIDAERNSLGALVDVGPVIFAFIVGIILLLIIIVWSS